MELKPNKSGYGITTALVASLLLASCGGGSSSSPTNPTPPANPIINSYDITILNVTNNQPLSPVAIASHVSSYSAWTVGTAASVGIEYIAEAGNNDQFRDSLNTLDATSASGKGLIFPGKRETITINSSATTQTAITIATMLVNTNDAFAGIKGIDVSAMASGDTMTLFAHVYDAGTELNSEATGTMPGPVEKGKGEGFNADRSDFNNIVRSHGGVVTMNDGLSTSVLDQSHRFDNPGMIVTITKK